MHGRLCCFVTWVFGLLAFNSLALSSGKMIPSVDEYFPSLHGNLMDIAWAHATNSQSKLKAGLENSSIHMLEADIVFGHLLNGSGPMPIMGHPPATTSDLSLQEFVAAVIDAQANTKKGIKLDFKSDQAFNVSCLVLDKLKDKLNFPVWMNADILVGPSEPTSTPLNASNFLAQSTEHLPDALLSLGWTTAFQPAATYTPQMLAAMLQVVEDRGVSNPITLAVRAAFAALAGNELVQLLNDIDRYQNKTSTTLTVWMSDPKDVVDVPKLRQLVTTLGKRKVALDVPDDLKQQITS